MKNSVVFRNSSQPFQAALFQREQDKQLRRLRASRPLGLVEIALDNKRLVNFASNDYLGLSQHNLLKERAVEYVERYGVGAPASRLLSGNLDCYEQIEQKLARLKGKEAALIFSSGFQANMTVLSALIGRNSVVAADRMNHRSLLEGLQLSGAQWFRYKHNSLADLMARFSRYDHAAPALGASDSDLDDKRNRAARGQNCSRWIVTESIFSMDGDTADLDGVLASANELGAELYVDEAHATGVCGTNGMGLTAGRSDVTVSMGTFGKGLGSFGSYIACSNVLRDYLINFCSGLIYSTALPPAVLGAIDAALDIVPSLTGERETLHQNATLLRLEAAKLGFDTGKSDSQIVPLIVGSESQATGLAAFLEDNGMFAPAIRPPTVAPGKSRVRISLSAHHTQAQIEKLITTLGKWNGRTA